MSIKHNNCSEENYWNKSDAVSEESVIESTPTHTPVKKKRKKVRHNANLKKKSLKEDQGNETELLEKLVIEFNRHEIHNNFKFQESISNNLQNINNRQVFEVYKSGPSTSKGETFSLSYSLQSPKDLENKITPNSVATGLETKINNSGSLDELQNKLNRPKYSGITEPIQKTVAKNRHSLFVFYLINEVLQFTPNNFPKNSCIQLIGRFKFNEQNKLHVLCSYEKNYGGNYQVKVDLREMFVKPDGEEKIILFGELCFENSTPIVVGKFYQQSVVDYQTYVELMLQLRTTVPRENFSMICVTNDDLKCDETVEEYDEEFFNDLTRSLSEEQVETYDLSDSKLCAFLDDISFENL